MGQSFCLHHESARQLFARADEVLGWSLREVCFGGPEERLTRTSVCQPALYVTGYVGANLLRQSGLKASAALGLSLGELTALAIAEAFDFETGLRVVAERGRLMQLACESTRGTMASLIGGELGMVESLCQEYGIDVANLNCPGQVVVSGEEERVHACVEAAKAGGQFKMVVPLKVAGAYHSRLMEPARAAFAEFLSAVPISRPAVPVFSNVTGAAVDAPDEIRQALVQQVVAPVRWEACMRSAASLGIDDFYECGPGAVLAGLAKRTERSWKVHPAAESDDLMGLLGVGSGGAR